MWALFVDGVLVAWYPSECDAVEASLRQPYGCDIHVRSESEVCTCSTCLLGIGYLCPYTVGGC